MAARMKLIIFASSSLKLARSDRIFGRLDVRPLPVVCAQRQFCSDSGEKKKEINLKLAKPGGAKTRRNLNITDADLKKAPTAEKSQSPVEEGLAPELISAVDSVAKSLNHDPDITRSDLLQKLQEHNNASQTGPKKEPSSVSSLFAGMTVDKLKKPDGYDKPRRANETSGIKLRPSTSDARAPDSGERLDRRPRRDHVDKRRSEEEDEDQAKRSEQYRQFQRQRWEEGPGDKRGGDRKFPRRVVADIKLFDGPAMGIFTKKQDKHKGSITVSDPALSVSIQKSSTIFDDLEQEERHKMMSMPPSNAFEEMIRWTREGKLWNFPIDNDQGMKEEANVGFHEHIFLDHLLEVFPKKGPVRHFMELVVVGLSHNPYFSVQEKHDHIAWFTNYFKDKYELIEESPSSLAPSIEGAEQLKL